MQIIFYKAPYCPRCNHAEKILRRHLADYPDASIEVVNVLQSPQKALARGILMVPAMKINEQKLASIWLSEQSIVTFLELQLNNQPPSTTK